MATKLRFDEINALGDYLRSVNDEQGTIRNLNADDLIETLIDIYISEYLLGVAQANESIKTEIAPDIDKMSAAINKRFDGKDFKDRVREYVEADDVESIMRVAETDSTRIYNDGVLNTGLASGKSVMKRWETMLDGRVRDTHDYLQGMEVPIGSKFFTFDGDSADYPGGFNMVENNANCRCTIDLITV